MAQATSPAELEAARYWAKLTDSRFSVLGLRFGLDSLVGLIPVVGDALMLVPALRILWLAAQLGVPAGMLIRMLVNILLDLILGAVPVLGDLFDLFYKANQANLRLLESWWQGQQHA